VSRLHRLALIVPLVLLLAAGACSSAPAEPVRITDPTGPATPLAVATPTGDQGLLPGDRWPSACDLVDDAALRAVLPQATDVRREPRSGSVRVTSTEPGVLGRRLGERTETVQGLSCSTRFSLPGAALDPDRPNVTGAELRTSVVAAGSPDAVENATPFGTGPAPEDRVGGRCEAQAGSRDCLKGNLRFTVAFTVPTADDIDDPITLAAPDGTRTFERFDGRAKLEFARTEVDPRLADAVLARLG
jgi:hypothetical protein